VYNLFTQVLVAGVALWAIPIIVRGLSKEGFGLLAIVWAFVGYFTLLDFGVSRAATKYFSEAAGRGSHTEMYNLLWSSVNSMFVIGLISVVITISATPLLVDHVFHVSESMHQEAVRAFYLSAIGIPFMLIFGVLKGLQMALQRFDLVNLFQALLNGAQYAGSVAVLMMGYGLQEVILLTVGIRVALTLVSFILLPRLVPGSFTNIRLWDVVSLKRLYSFGGWITISQIISPLFLYLDRFFIGFFISLGAVTYYVVPQEALTRLLLIPMSLTTTLFPALSEYSSRPEHSQKTETMYYRSSKYMVFGMMPLILLFGLFAPEILSLWLGKEFASHCQTIFRILCVGLFFNSLAQIPITVLHAFGKPSVTAKFHLIELPVMVLLSVILIPMFGILGAAVSWSIRVVLDCGLLFWAVRHYLGEIVTPLGRNFHIVRNAMPLVPLIIMTAVVTLVPGVPLKLAITFTLAIVYVSSTWLYGLDETDRSFLNGLRKRLVS
jgi:O-antigen/teichoic acid export membrane protein